MDIRVKKSERDGRVDIFVTFIKHFLGEYKKADEEEDGKSYSLIPIPHEIFLSLWIHDASLGLGEPTNLEFETRRPQRNV